MMFQFSCALCWWHFEFESLSNFIFFMFSDQLLTWHMVWYCLVSAYSDHTCLIRPAHMDCSDGYVTHFCVLQPYFCHFCLFLFIFIIISWNLKSHCKIFVNRLSCLIYCFINQNYICTSKASVASCINSVVWLTGMVICILKQMRWEWGKNEYFASWKLLSLLTCIADSLA